jgi:hypothetical protein
MAYDVTLVEFVTPGVGGISNPSSPAGFPATPFDYLLTSMWVCLSYGTGFGTNFTAHWPFFEAHPQATANAIQVRLFNLTTVFFDATYNVPFRSLRSHILISVNCVAQIVQVYINDVAVTLTSGGFTAALRMAIGADHTFNLNGAGTAAGHGGAIADVWSANTPAFVDLSVAANRRKFIHADLSPVDLGATGMGPTGTQPPVFLTVPAGGVPSDFRTNYGTGGAFSGTFSTLTLGLQAPGVCTLPPPPPKLAMDDVNCTTIPSLERNLVFVEWSDDRGHSWGNPVGQPMGEAGEYRTSLQWQRLGMGRDRVFRIFWSVPTNTALQGCWLDSKAASS